MLVFFLALLLYPFDATQPKGCLMPAEEARLQRTAKLDDRIKIFEKGSQRCRDLTMRALAGDAPASISGILPGWMQLLKDALADIEAKADPHKKSKPLIRFEIQLRKAITDLDKVKLKAPYEQMEELDTWLSEADRIRARFVDILFQR